MDALTLRHKRFDGSWTQGIRRELFQRGDAVAVLPWDVQEDRVILIEQFRPGAIRGADSPWMLEAIAGVVEDGESDETVAHREALEEAGCVMDTLLPITSYYPSPGACSEQIRLFIGRLTSSRRSCSKSTSMSGGSPRYSDIKRSKTMVIVSGPTSVTPKA